MPSLLVKELASQAVDDEFIVCCETFCDARSRKTAKLHSIVKSLRLLDAASEPILRAESSLEHPSLILSLEPGLQINWIGTYKQIEGVLLAFLSYYGIGLARVRHLTGDTSVLNFLEVFDDVKNPLHSMLGTRSVEGPDSPIAAVPALRDVLDLMRRHTTWALSHYSANSKSIELISFDCSYELYYTVLFQKLVECLDICMRDASKTECSASCKTRERSGAQGVAQTKQTFTRETDHCGGGCDKSEKLGQHASDQHQASSPTTTTEPQSVEQALKAGLATKEFAHAKLLGITVQASVEAKAIASQLRISDRLRALMEEVPTARTGTGQQLQGSSSRAVTCPYRAPQSFQGAKPHDTFNAKRSAKPATTSLARFGKVEAANDSTKKTRAVAPPEYLDEATRSDQTILKPHIAQFEDIGSTSLPLSTETVDVQSGQLTEAATNSTPLQKVLADLFLHKSLLAKARHENAGLIQERDDLKSKLLRVYEEHAASFKKKDDLANGLRRGFNAVMDDLLRST
ncbi:MAG: hypothetical protein Q9207_005375 [Kuettlingeria erythrocarpa]